MSAVPGYAPPEDPIAAPFWEGIESGEIRLPRCSVCGRWQWYPTAVGADCAGGELVWETVSDRGTLHTFTRVQRSFLPGGHGALPYVVGFVELDGVDGIRLVANVNDDDGSVEVGMPVKATFVTVSDRRHLVFERA